MIDKTATYNVMSTDTNMHDSITLECFNPQNLNREPKSVLDELHEKQENRVKNLYNSAEVNLNTINARSTRPYRHSTLSSSHRGVNNKNKYNKILQVRERYREDKIRLNREKAHDIQSYNDYLDQCEIDSRELLQFADIDQLVNEENELELDPVHQPELELSLEEIMEMLNIIDT